MQKDSRAYLMALTAMNVRVLAEIVALAPDKDKARDLLMHFEKTINDDIGKLAVSLNDGEGPETTDELRASARRLVADWLASLRFK